MKLEEALNYCQPNQCLVREAWIKDGKIMKLISSAKTINEFKQNIELTTESLNADDWNIYEMSE